MMMFCCLCDKSANLLCKKCDQNWFCSENHLNDHNKLCGNSRISKCNILGRHLIANRDFKIGEIILKETPKLIGPKPITKPICINCFQLPARGTQLTTCPKCKIAPICSLKCSGFNHSNIECDFFSKYVFEKSNECFLFENFQVVAVLKFLCLKFYQEEIWNKLILLESHLESRKANKSVWDFYDSYFTKAIDQLNILSATETENNLIQKICGILDVNSFELRVPALDPSKPVVKSIRGIYINSSYLSHECIGNVSIAVDDNYLMVIRAKTNIRKNEALFYNYGDFFKNNRQRQEFIREGKYFDCKCRRCLDPTEFGTFLSSPKCSACKTGQLVENYSVTTDNKWTCNNSLCGKKYSQLLIDSTLNRVNDLIEMTDKTNIDNVENLLKKLKNTLSEHHSQLIELKQLLINLYSSKIALDENPESDEILRKIDLLTDMLYYVEKLDPFNTRIKGLYMYQIHIPIVMNANRSYNEKKINVNELYKQLLKAETFLTKSVGFLLYEPRNSTEGRLANSALVELKILRDSINKFSLLKK